MTQNFLMELHEATILLIGRGLHSCTCQLTGTCWLYIIGLKLILMRITIGGWKWEEYRASRRKKPGDMY